MDTALLNACQFLLLAGAQSGKEAALNEVTDAAYFEVEPATFRKVLKFVMSGELGSVPNRALRNLELETRIAFLLSILLLL